MTTMNQTTVIIASKAGRLGNRLFQGAHFMGNALSKGYQLFNPSLGEYAHLFEGSARDPLCGFPQPWRDDDPEFADQCRQILFQGVQLLGMATVRGMITGVKSVDIRRFDEVEGGDVDLKGEVFTPLLEAGQLILPMGWKFSDHSGIQKHRKEIVRYFTPVESIRKPAEKIVSHARELGDLLVGVHIRQDDYRQWKNGIHFYETERYAQWMRELSERNSDNKVVFLVCASNSLDESLFNDLSVVKGPGSPCGDLYALSLCDKIIGPPSTFSGWASYHGGVPLCMLQNAFTSVARENFVRF
jgi:hypothetical protein